MLIFFMAPDKAKIMRSGRGIFRRPRRAIAILPWPRFAKNLPGFSPRRVAKIGV